MRFKVETRHYPRLTEWHLRKALAWMNPLDVAGIEFIRLLTDEPASQTAQQPAYRRGHAVIGEYFQPNPKAKHARPPHINIYTRPLYYGIPGPLKYTPVATLRAAFVLAHEVGHHLLARRGYVYTPAEQYKPPGFRDERREGAANSYGVDLVRRMYARRHYRAGRWLSDKVSGLYFEMGMAAGERGHHERAAYKLFCSYFANPENDEAAHAYRHASALANLSATKSDQVRRPTSLQADR